MKYRSGPKKLVDFYKKTDWRGDSGDYGLYFEDFVEAGETENIVYVLVYVDDS